MPQDECGSGDTVSNGVSSADAHPFALADVEACSVAVPSGDACSVAVRSGDACSAAALVVRVSLAFFDGGSTASLSSGSSYSPVCPASSLSSSMSCDSEPCSVAAAASMFPCASMMMQRKINCMPRGNGRLELVIIATVHQWLSISHTTSHIQTNKLRPTGLGIQATSALVNRCFARSTC